MTMPTTLTPTVYPALDDHQQRINPALVEDPREKQRTELFAGWLKEFHRWKAIYVSEFKIELPPVAFCIKSTRANCYGYFRPGVNEFGLTREIAINHHYIGRREKWQVLGTLLHELLHAWQDAFGDAGKRNYHNKQLRAKAKGYGLDIDSRGYTQYDVESPFKELLAKHGVNVPVHEEPTAPVRGTSTLNKWICQCKPPVALRVGRAEIRVQCLDCRAKFVQAES